MALDVARGNGQRLKVLRAINGLTQADLAQRLNVTQSFLSHLERGNRPIPDALLIRSSGAFNVPASFFAVHPSLADVGPVTFRKNSLASARDEARIVALYDEASRVFREMSESSGYHTVDLPDPGEHNNDPESVAQAMRARSGLGSDEPVLNAIRTLERWGIGVVDNLDHLDEDTRGHTAVSRPSHFNCRPLVALISTVPGAVKRLTVLHEAGHLIFDRDLSSPVGTRSPEEKRAYRFAGAFLLPENVVRRRVSEPLNLHGYLPIKADYGISVAAIIVRARELNAISAGRARSLQIQLASQGWRYNEPVPVADERPILLGQAIRKVYGSQPIAKAAHATGTAPEWIRTWTHANVETGSREFGQVIDLAQRRCAAHSRRAI